MNRTPRTFFVNRFYWPDEPATAQLLTDLAEALAGEGRAVTVITSRPSEALPVSQVRNGVEILRVSARRKGGTGLLAKAGDYLGFARGALRLLSERVQRDDIVVLMTDPPLLATRATGLVQSKGARVVHWVQDVFPEIASAVGSVPAAGLLRHWRDRAWAKADALVVPGSDMADLVTGHGVPRQRVVVCPNWAPRELAPTPKTAAAQLKRDWGLNGKFLLVYSGNLGRVHDLLPVLDLAEELRGESDIVFLFIGHGAQRALLERVASRRGLSNVRFKPAQPRIRLAETLALADVHLITVLPGCEALVFPSKLYGIAAVGRPALFVGRQQCEAARIITRHGFGAAFPRDQMPKAAGIIRELRSYQPRLEALGQAAAQWSKDHARLEHALPRWRKVLDELMPLAQNTTRRSD